MQNKGKKEESGEIVEYDMVCLSGGSGGGKEWANPD